jgi:NTE family protein
MNISLPPRPATYDKKLALVLQGGGALGSYQAGVYEALATTEYLPDWIAGVSIGAINAAIIAGNPVEHRVARLRQFWTEVTTPAFPLQTTLEAVDAALAPASALMCGQTGFFAPRPPLAFWFGVAPSSYYDTTALRCGTRWKGWLTSTGSIVARRGFRSAPSMSRPEISNILIASGWRSAPST